MNLAQTIYPDEEAKLVYMSDCSSQRITIYKNEKHTWLLVSDVVQSAIENTLPYRPIVPYSFVMLLPLLHHKTPDTILELGGGGLSIQRYLSYAYPSIKMTSIDDNGDILKAVDEFFPPISNPTVIQKDAFRYINSALESGGKFDWILSDLFDGEQSPVLAKRQILYKQLFEMINPNGWLIINCLTDSDEEIEQLGKSLKLIFNNKYYVFAVPNVMNKIVMINKIKDFDFPLEIETYNSAK